MKHPPTMISVLTSETLAERALLRQTATLSGFLDRENEMVEKIQRMEKELSSDLLHKQHAEKLYENPFTSELENRLTQKMHTPGDEDEVVSDLNSSQSMSGGGKRNNSGKKGVPEHFVANIGEKKIRQNRINVVSVGLEKKKARSITTPQASIQSGKMPVSAQQEKIAEITAKNKITQIETDKVGLTKPLTDDMVVVKKPVIDKKEASKKLERRALQTAGPSAWHTPVELASKGRVEKTDRRYGTELRQQDKTGSPAEQTLEYYIGKLAPGLQKERFYQSSPGVWQGGGKEKLVDTRLEKNNNRIEAGNTGISAATEIHQPESSLLKEDVTGQRFADIPAQQTGLRGLVSKTQGLVQTQSDTAEKHNTQTIDVSTTDRSSKRATAADIAEILLEEALRAGINLEQLRP